MARWDPGTEKRLVEAALALYSDQGYDNVTGWGSPDGSAFLDAEWAAVNG